MGYLNSVTGYRKDSLVNCTIVKHGNFTLLTLDGLIKNIIPDFENCDTTILSTPKLGASSIDHLVTLYQNDDSQRGFSDKGIETFLYVISENITAKAESKTSALNEGGYPYCPPGPLMTFVNAQTEGSQILLYKHHYVPAEGYTPQLVFDNTSELEHIHYEGMDGVILLDFLPRELGFDTNIRILSFTPGVSHSYIETYVQEHGAYVLSGQGICSLDSNWIPMEEGDHIFIGAYSSQAGYGVGHGKASSYIYSEDCNRNVEV